MKLCMRIRGDWTRYVRVHRFIIICFNAR